MPPGSVAAWDCLRRIDVGGVVDDAALRELIAAEAEAAERRLSPTSGMMVQALWFDAGPARAGRLWLRSIILRSTGCRGGSWCRTLRRPGRRSRPDRQWRCRRGGHRSGIGRSGWRRMRGPTALRRSFHSGAGCNASRRCSLLGGAARSGARHAWHGRASDADVAVGGDGCAADAGAGGVPWRHRRRAADRAGAGGGGLVPASCPGRHSCRPSWRQPRGAARPRRPWS